MTQEQFNTFVFPEPNTGCWLWSGRTNNKGYGIGHWPDKIQLAHRYSFSIYKENPKGKCVLHHCDNTYCVNPDHLYLGDMAQNCKDRDSRGRQKTPRGTNHKLSKITEQDAINIRIRYFVEKNVTQRQLAKIYGISQRKILDILKGRSWKHVLPQ